MCTDNIITRQWFLEEQDTVEKDDLQPRMVS